jgi:hypothetical protein
MTTDRELLEAAAKAAGMHVDMRSSVPDWLWVRETKTHGLYRPWRPLDDDGDALRLGSALRINVEYVRTMGGINTGVNAWPAGRGDCGMTVEGDDAAVCARRAIVCAAAAMAEVTK